MLEFIRQLEAYSGLIQPILTFALVLATIFYAKRTHDIVQVMRETRETQILPRLKLSFEPIGPMYSDIRINNVGPGAAINIAVSISFPDASDSDIFWPSQVLVSGESHDFLFPKISDGTVFKNDELPKQYSRLIMDADYEDASGKEYKIHEEIDFVEYWTKLKSSGQLLEQDFEKQTNDSLKSMSKSLNEIANHISRRNK